MEEQDLLLIEKYIDDSLMEDEQSLFQEKWKNVSGFREEVIFQKSIISAIKANEKATLKNEMKTIYNRIKINQKHQNKSVMKTHMKSFYKIAAVAVLMILAITTYFYITPDKHEELFQAYYESFPEDPLTRGDKLDGYDEAMKVYGKGEYKAAIPLFQKIISQHPENLRYYLFLGNCYLNNDDIEMAINSFEKVEVIDDAIIKSHAEWYIALCYLKADDSKKAIAKLAEIKENNGPYKSDAEKLLSELK